MQAVHPWNGPRKGSLQYGDLSNIRPRSPSFEIPSPSVSPDRSVSPREYADATDPHSPRDRKDHQQQIEPWPSNPHQDNLSDASNRSNPPSYTRCGRRVAQPPQYDLDSIILSPRQRGPPSPPSKSEYVPIEGLAHGFASSADVYGALIKYHGSTKSQRGVKAGYGGWSKSKKRSGKKHQQLIVITGFEEDYDGLSKSWHGSKLDITD